MSFLENGMSEDCQWVLMYNTLMYGNYLVPKKLVEGALLDVMTKNNCVIVVPNTISFVC